MRQELRDHGMSETEIALTLHCSQLRGDHARYFTSEGNTIEMTSAGITVVFSAPYTPTSNAYIERLHQTLMASAFAMIYHGAAPINTWCYAAELALKIYKICPHNSLPEKQSPQQYVTNEVPSYEWLHIYWSIAAVYIPAIQRGKGQPKCIFGRWVGYDYLTRTHLVLIPSGSSWILRATAHIRIDPNSQPARPEAIRMPDTLSFDTNTKRKTEKKSVDNIQPLGQHAITIPLSNGWQRVIDPTGIHTGYTKNGSAKRDEPPTVEQIQPEQQQPTIDGVTCEQCHKKLPASRMKRGQRYCLICERKLEKQRETYMKQQQSSPKPTSTLAVRLNDTTIPVEPTNSIETSESGVTTPIETQTYNDPDIRHQPILTQMDNSDQGVSYPINEHLQVNNTTKQSKRRNGAITKIPNQPRRTQRTSRPPVRYNFKLAKQINDETTVSTSDYRTNTANTVETIRTIHSAIKRAPAAYIRRYTSLCNENIEHNPIDQICHARTVDNANEITKLSTLMGALRWLGTHPEIDDPLEPIRRAKTSAINDWSDRIFYSYKQTQHPDNPYRHLMEAARKKELDALMQPGHNGRRPALTAVDRDSLPKKHQDRQTTYTVLL